jgi:hypothetical protein
MKIKNSFITFVRLCFINISAYAGVIIDKNTSHDNQINGYVQDSSLSFSIIDGQSLKPSRSMQRLSFEFNAKIITIQQSPNQEFYVKGQDKDDRIITLSDEDYTLLKQVTTDLFKEGGDTGYVSSIETLGKAFNLLSSWPSNMPLLI